MKRIKFIALMFVTMLIAGTGCLKDKDYDNHEYGINDPDASPKGVGFNLGVKIRSTAGLNVADTSQNISNIVNVSLFSGTPAPSDIHIRLEIDPTIVAEYDTLNGTVIEQFDASLYDIGSLDIVIPKDSQIAKLVIKVPSTMALDPVKTYGIGLRIAQVDAGYTIATNHERLLVEVALKNKYDGVYNLKGYHNRDPYTFPYDVEEYMVTAGPAAVAFYWPERNDFGHPIGTAPGQTNWYGNGVAPVVVFDPATDLVTDVYNSTGTPPITMYTGPGAGISRYDAATQTMYVYWNYNNNPLRAFFDTLVYTGPRP